jgi:hypothetical protein
VVEIDQNHEKGQNRRSTLKISEQPRKWIELSLKSPQVRLWGTCNLTLMTPHPWPPLYEPEPLNPSFVKRSWDLKRLQLGIVTFRLSINSKLHFGVLDAIPQRD